MQNKTDFDLTLLPNIFKKIGLAVIISTIAGAAILKNLEPMQAHKALLKLIVMNSLIVGLLLIVMAKEKVEDEMTLQLRLKVISYTFIWVVVFVLVRTTVDFYDDSMRPISGQEAVFGLLIGYLCFSFIQKKGLR